MPFTQTNTYGMPGASNGNLSIQGTLNGGTSGSASNTYSMSYAPVPDPYDTPDLPEMVIVTSDENHNVVKMTLAPEAGISNSELVKLFMLVTAMSVAPNQFNALAHVKKNNLERHFKYS